MSPLTARIEEIYIHDGLFWRRLTGVGRLSSRWYFRDFFLNTLRVLPCTWHLFTRNTPRARAGLLAADGINARSTAFNCGAYILGKKRHNVSNLGDAYGQANARFASQ